MRKLVRFYGLRSGAYVAERGFSCNLAEGRGEIE